MAHSVPDLKRDSVGFSCSVSSEGSGSVSSHPVPRSTLVPQIGLYATWAVFSGEVLWLTASPCQSKLSAARRALLMSSPSVLVTRKTSPISAGPAFSPAKSATWTERAGLSTPLAFHQSLRFRSMHSLLRNLGQVRVEHPTFQLLKHL